jgi:hypothetical protein
MVLPFSLKYFSSSLWICNLNLLASLAFKFLSFAGEAFKANEIFMGKDPRKQEKSKQGEENNQPMGCKYETVLPESV